ncbi:aminotransferase class V-fold PLP-dependent enzyme [Paenibacillus sp. HJL G12]|uniref:Aminotransferase class V-fold PLP-dependent enzyme n=1 Tax=Paenibacillus dendrobii TaxID=2691084 RepID=A0A7X3LHK9_9BACL|nr:cysteine desulfurase family protein [Paenibacillus dendrobii]MWV45262.1 aminotransferase class V-fold PLP-dependent enzyme [Paenibacillus dendrobii]
MIYWDHAASTPPYDEVIQTMAEVMKKHYGNPSSIHSMGEDAAKLIKRAREVCASSLNVKPSEVILTSGATEGNNMAIKGAALQYESRGKHIITTRIEHPSVYDSCLALEKQGYEVTFLPVDGKGMVDPSELASAVRKDTILVSIMHVNNETGAVQPLAEIGHALKQANPLTVFHIDGVQGFGKLPVRLDEWKADLYTLSAHKIRGPKGTGVLYKREGIMLHPLLSGGKQESGLRAGTENIPGFVAMSKAMRMAAEQTDAFMKEVGALKAGLLAWIRNTPGLELNSFEEGAAHIVNVSFPGMKAEVLLHTLEEHGMLVSTKSACSSKTSEPSRVLLAMGRSVDAASSAIRISMGMTNTQQDLNKLQMALEAAVSRLQPLRQEGMK